MNSNRLVEAIYLSDTQVQIVMPFGSLAELVDDPDPDPRKGRKKGKERVPSAREVRATALRNEVQRHFVGSKKANVKRYRDYIEKILEGAIGDCPEIALWTEAKLEFTQAAQSVDLRILAIPAEGAIVAIDGETQLAARFDLLAHGRGSAARVVARLHHGIDIAAARQIFHDRNRLGVKVSAAHAIAFNSRSSVTSFANELRDLNPDLFTNNTSDPIKIPFTLLHQALLWSAVGRVKEPGPRIVPPDYREQLDRAYQHLRTRLPLLHRFITNETTQRIARRPAMFVAMTDSAVTAQNLDEINWADQDWLAYKESAEPANIKAFVRKLHGEVLDFSQGQPTNTDPTEAHDMTT